MPVENYPYTSSTSSEGINSRVLLTDAPALSFCAA